MDWLLLDTWVRIYMQTVKPSLYITTHSYVWLSPNGVPPKVREPILSHLYPLIPLLIGPAGEQRFYKVKSWRPDSRNIE